MNWRYFLRNTCANLVTIANKCDVFCHFSQDNNRHDPCRLMKNLYCLSLVACTWIISLMPLYEVEESQVDTRTRPRWCIRAQIMVFVVSGVVVVAEVVMRCRLPVHGSVQPVLLNLVQSRLSVWIIFLYEIFLCAFPCRVILCRIVISFASVHASFPSNVIIFMSLYPSVRPSVPSFNHTASGRSCRSFTV